MHSLNEQFKSVVKISKYSFCNIHKLDDKGGFLITFSCWSNILNQIFYIYIMLYWSSSAISFHVNKILKSHKERLLHTSVTHIPSAFFFYQRYFDLYGYRPTSFVLCLLSISVTKTYKILFTLVFGNWPMSNKRSFYPTNSLNLSLWRPTWLFLSTLTH